MQPGRKCVFLNRIFLRFLPDVCNPDLHLRAVTGRARNADRGPEPDYYHGDCHSADPRFQEADGG